VPLYLKSEKELLAIVIAIEHFNTYLYGRKVIVYSDHQPLTWLMNKQNPHSLVNRWLICLSLYDFDLTYDLAYHFAFDNTALKEMSENALNDIIIVT
jgi:hypothetical protein